MQLTAFPHRLYTHLWKPPNGAFPTDFSQTSKTNDVDNLKSIVTVTKNKCTSVLEFDWLTQRSMYRAVIRSLYIRAWELRSGFNENGSGQNESSFYTVLSPFICGKMLKIEFAHHWIRPRGTWY